MRQEIERIRKLAAQLANQLLILRVLANGGFGDVSTAIVVELFLLDDPRQFDKEPLLQRRVGRIVKYCNGRILAEQAKQRAKSEDGGPLLYPEQLAKSKEEERKLKELLQWVNPSATGRNLN
jgi:hypothetical protein